MEISLLDSIGRKAGVVGITGYQKYISPHKGFVCAHRVLHGGESCSQYIKRVIAEDGFKGLLTKSRKRFQACKQANQILRSQADNSEPTEDEEGANLHSPKKVLGNTAKKSSYSSSNSTDCIDCADVSCNCAELLNMTPDCNAVDCSSLDCSAVDCGSLDCSGADCSFLDCGSCG
ncbi:MAG: membrane protein insertion efficiency factor YidD [Aulosira sp. ZfuVER01]|nr:membrane protein insertion efficiency factor YidD [Aulosira sp. ZfuVER01]MDZ7997188.1 membrane protein insertion efficiency factor YidD [Aulosira sp. DedVER01a]MDZ8056037.1 membrane protein insertion efficiency factor YidD [Aulosira sp. ZfuCHP01]